MGNSQIVWFYDYTTIRWVTRTIVAVQTTWVCVLADFVKIITFTRSNVLVFIHGNVSEMKSFIRLLR